MSSESALQASVGMPNPVMQNRAKRWAIRILAWCASSMAWILKYGAETPAAKARLGEIYSLIRHCAAENDRDSVRQKYDIHPTVNWGLDTWIFGDGEISIGENTYLGRDCFVVSHPSGAKIRIGKNCAISHNVHIRTHRNDKEVVLKNGHGNSPVARDISIGDSVLVGANVFIRGGVTIGDYCVVGANSVVTSDVSPHTVSGGVPARVIRRKSD